MNRREFGKVVGVGALGLPLVTDADNLHTESAAAPDRQKVKPTKTPRSDADLLLELLRRDFPDKRLTGPILSEIRGQLAENQRRSWRLSRFPLTNADEPTPMFIPYRGE